MNEEKRPPYRWFLIGPKRSGSTLHTDPLMTSAWNTSLNGHKLWVMFPWDYPKWIVNGKNVRKELERTLRPLITSGIISLALSKRKDRSKA